MQGYAQVRGKGVGRRRERGGKGDGEMQGYAQVRKGLVAGEISP